jgi:hypothetical protein
MVKVWGLTGALLAMIGCGSSPSRVGITVNQISVSKVRLGNSPADLAMRQVALSSPWARVQADVLGDAAPEVLSPLPGGRGLEIRNQAGTRLGMVETAEYLTDFSTVPSWTSDKQNFVLYTYPNTERGGTFRVLAPDQQELATWTVMPAPGRFTVAAWKGTTALFYTHGDSIEVRAPTGEGLMRLPAAEGHLFQSIRVATLSEDRLVVLLSGDGYTPYHMVCVYDLAGQLLFQEIADEHAFELEAEPNASSFVVFARSSRWEYTIRSPAAP